MKINNYNIKLIKNKKLVYKSIYTNINLDNNLINIFIFLIKNEKKFFNYILLIKVLLNFKSKINIYYY